MDFLDGLLGPGVVYVSADGFLELSDAAFEAGLHLAKPPKGQRCWCLACSAQRDRERTAAMPAYLAILRSERPADHEEIRRVRALLPERALPRAVQPWEPRPAKTPEDAGDIPDAEYG